jgi:ubiquinone/menaquinone biosynthesis C-methylase UbiE
VRSRIAVWRIAVNLEVYCGTALTLEPYCRTLLLAHSDAWQKPEAILDALHLKRTSIVADIGAGTGYFSVRIAKRIPEGKI